MERYQCYNGLATTLSRFKYLDQTVARKKAESILTIAQKELQALIGH